MENILFITLYSLLYLVIGAAVISLLADAIRPITNWPGKLLMVLCIGTWPLLFPAFVIYFIWCVVKDILES